MRQVKRSSQGIVTRALWFATFEIENDLLRIRFKIRHLHLFEDDVEAHSSNESETVALLGNAWQSEHCQLSISWKEQSEFDPFLSSV